MRERFIDTAPGKESGVREAKGPFIVESECPQFLRTCSGAAAWSSLPRQNIGRCGKSFG
jgi:hypothetical protein